MITNVPFAFDADFYRGAHPDLGGLTAEQAHDHFRAHGHEEGRQATPLGSRPALVDYIASLGSVLEIGPFFSPIVRGENVRYLDMFDADELRRRASSIGADATNCPEKIHYVGDIADVDETFDAVVSSHSIEHQTDLIHHFNNVARILKPGGKYVLIIPDKRYCFDHYIPESTIGDVIQAHREKRTRHTLRSLIEYFSAGTHNNAIEHWAGDHGAQDPAYQRARVAEAIAVYDSTDEYLDMHAWYFTPYNFHHIVDTLHALGMTKLRPTTIFPTLFNQLEFFAILERV